MSTRVCEVQEQHTRSSMDTSRQGLLPLTRTDSTSTRTGPTSGKCRPRRTRPPKSTEWRSVDSGCDDALGDLHTKLALIQWRKHMNDSYIRKALDVTKRMHNRDLMLQLAVDREWEREQRAEAIIRDELSRKAVLSEPLLKDWENQEEKNRKQQLKETKLRLKTIRQAERVVRPKKDSGGKLTFLDKECLPLEDGHHRVLSGKEEKNSRMELKDKLGTLKRGVKKKRRELIRAGKEGCKYGSNAASFKTGRGSIL